MARTELTYGAYLHLPELLSAQQPISSPEHHDELLFIIQHQTSELWLKLVLHELLHARDQLDADQLRPALKSLARVKHVQRQLSEQWSVLATLTPSEYAGFRRQLGTSSGFQSWQYRAVEVLLGAKDPGWVDHFAGDPPAAALLSRLLGEPSLYDAFWRWLARHGHPVPGAVTGRDVRQPWTYDPDLLGVLVAIYRDTATWWEAYETCEALVDVDDGLALWRFRHLQTVARTIGTRRGTGGTSGVGYLRAVVERSCFPELHAMRSELGDLG